MAANTPIFWEYLIEVYQGVHLASWWTYMSQEHPGNEVGYSSSYVVSCNSFFVKFYIEYIEYKKVSYVTWGHRWTSMMWRVLEHLVSVQVCQ